ncbi:MAG: inositol monophosphatase [Candidatus Pacebacteria bacterium]|nr:inositol monophosphatase [Candidatus Paceibacterota bacterium]MCF7862724.1 inositol monophosphatase [Candidatus Paceibacterota bacterium]
MSEYKKELEIAKNIARDAGLIMLKYFDGDQHVEIKEDNSQVTIADKLINSLVIERLKVVFPEDGVVGEEESNTEYGTGRKWFCDPIDGTMAFIWGTPTSMFSLALVVDGIPVLGVVYDPFLDKLYEAVVNQGSFCNGHPLKVSNKELNDGLVVTTSSINKIMKRPNHLVRLSEMGVRFATFSGAVYKACLVAKGKAEAYFEDGVNAYDIAAVQVIVEESGGKVTNIKGEKLDYTKPFKGAVISNKTSHDEMVKCCS